MPAHQLATEFLQHPQGAVEEFTGGSVVRQVGKAGRNAAYEMNSTIAKQILKSVTSRS